jgi:prepilin-type N-terminal cleavage/methylation domain-containing protein
MGPLGKDRYRWFSHPPGKPVRSRSGQHRVRTTRAFTLVELPVELPAMSSRKRAAFTLVELLVVIGIVAVLIGILLPALIGARARSRDLTCMTNLRQVGTALRAYSVDWRDVLPAPEAS